MNTKLLLLFFGFAFLASSSHGQKIYRDGLIGNNHLIASRGETRALTSNMNFVRKITKDGTVKENVEGSRYFNESFLFSKIFLKGNPYKEVFSARYNAFEDIIELDKGDFHEALLKDKDVTCSIAGELYIYQNYISKKGKKNNLGYLKLLYNDSNINLFVRQHVKFKEAKPAKTSMTASFPAKFIQKEIFYYRNSTMEASLPITKKSILTIFKDLHKDKIKSYIKANKIDLSNKNDLINLLKVNASLIK